MHLNSQFLSKSEDIIRNSNKTHRAVLEMQSSVRGYLLTSDTAFLQPYYNGLYGGSAYRRATPNLVTSFPVG
ncbi:hypothetical protein GR162_06685 [Flavobacterium sp. HBTb2-11-1]|nr:hypothetical protein [Flavobacterium sp. HBTb2-11-1]